MRVLSLVGSLLLAATMSGCRGCAEAQPDQSGVQFHANARTYGVRWDNGEVMFIEDYPGFLMGPEMRLRPGAKAPPKEPHPFMNAAFHGASFEKQLRGILTQSTNTDDFLRRVRREGYDVIQYSGPRGDGG
jgi:hypothetical protein